MFLDSIGLKETGLKRVIKKGYELLNYINFFTAGEKELRAWTIIIGTLAPQSLIHISEPTRHRIIT